MLSCCSAYYSKPLPDEQRFAVLDKALALGETFWDTADVYFDNEDLLATGSKEPGNALKYFLLLSLQTSTRRIPRGDTSFVAMLHM
jgi:aryl-alcohol dehydrogenase-like predicted oxidoreductase